MDGKIIVYAFALIALFGGVTGFYYTIDVDEAEKDFILTQQELGSVEESIKSAQKLTDLRKETAALISAARIIEAENETIRQEALKLSNSRDNANKAFMSAIQKVRDATVGMTFPSIHLSNGTVLKSAKIQALDESLTVIQHSEGVSKVPTEVLSTELHDRLRYGFIPGGAGSASTEAATDYTPSKKINQSSLSPLQNHGKTDVSDSLVRLGANAQLNKTAEKKSTTSTATYNPNDAKVNGDPSLWNGVDRFSIGRAYVPGQGWLKIGPKGPIPGTGRN